MIGLCLLLSKRLWAQQLIIDTDGGLDDLMAVNMIIQHKPTIIRAIITVEGLANPQDGAQRMRKLLDTHGLHNVPVFIGDTLPKDGHPFPMEWKEDNARIAQELFKNTKQHGSITPLPPDFYPTAAAQGIDLLALGPLTNLRHVKWTAKNHLTIMGGAWQVPGNVKESPTADSTNQVSEWNFYADPSAAAQVIKSKATIHLIPLDATHQLPLRVQDLRHLDKNGIAFSILSRMRTWLNSGTYYAWDPLAAAAYLSSSVVHYRQMPALVFTAPPLEGQLLVKEKGNRIFLGEEVCSNCFRKLFYDLY